MAVNNKPIFTGTPQISWVSTTVYNDLAGADLTAGTIGTDVYLAFTAGANGSYLQKMRFRAIGTTGQSTVATSARVWINNGSTIATFANSILIDEISLPAVTVSLTAASSNYELPLNFALPANYLVYVTIGTQQTAAAWHVTTFGGSYVAQA